MEKSPKHYWAICEGKNVLFAGSFNECWRSFVVTFGSYAVAELDTRGIRIARSN